jgi:ABC-type dipeptide/oligopeptide/nickel transport system permease component
MRVLFQTQGSEVKRHVVYETGLEGESGINFGTLSYKPVLDRMDTKKFVDNYASYDVFRSQPSMIGTSFRMGIIAVLMAYLLGLPIGLLMARHKDRLADKLGMVYIIFIIAVPSLAYIYLFRYTEASACGEITASACGAEGASAYAFASVAVRTGESRVHGYLAGFLPEGAAHIIVHSMIALARIGIFKGINIFLSFLHILS